MHILDIIIKKRDGQALSHREIAHFVEGYCRGTIADYQAAALLMAVCFRGMDAKETADLTAAMRDSGDVVDLSGIPGPTVDKHSTGGVGDTTSLVAVPLVAACGGKVAKMSGRGLGHTGGTLDKLESIPGFSVNRSRAQLMDTVSACGWSIVGQTDNLVPADKKLYALRSATGTVESIPLIAASIMSKKLAAGADAIVLDVKTGSGAFMEKSADAQRLARTMVKIGGQAGRPTLAVITDMSQPLGRAVGNALEVKEAIGILRGEHPGDLKTVSLALAARMLLAAGLARDEAAANAALGDALDSGRALDCLAAGIALQGGDPAVCRDTGLLPAAARVVAVKSDAAGYVNAMAARDIGRCALLLGAGRLSKDEAIDPAVGLWMHVRLGDRVARGDLLAELHVNRTERLDAVIRLFKRAVVIGPEPGQRPALIRGCIGGEGKSTVAECEW